LPKIVGILRELCEKLVGKPIFNGKNHAICKKVSKNGPNAEIAIFSRHIFHKDFFRLKLLIFAIILTHYLIFNI